jgi:hypothetical protein
MASQWQACGRPEAGPVSFVATGAAGSGKRSSPIPTSLRSRRMPCRRYNVRWRPLRKLRLTRRDRHDRRCRGCGGQRRFWPKNWKPARAPRTERPPHRQLAFRPSLPAFKPSLPALATPARRRRSRRLKAPQRSLPASLALSGASIGLGADLGASLGGCRGCGPGGYPCGSLGGGLGGCGARRCHACSALFSDLRSLTRRLSARAPIWSGPSRKPPRFLPCSVCR